MNIRSILEYTLAAVIVLSLGALSGWYFFLRSQTQTTAAQDAARGLGVPAPSFGGNTGSTYQNILSGVLGASSGGGGALATPPRLWQANRAPVAGLGFVTTGSSTKLLFAERADGYIFAADPTVGAITRLTNTLMPKTYEALFSNDGTLIERALDDAGNITTFVGTATSSTPQAGTSTASYVLSGSYVQKNINRIVINPTHAELFYFVRNASGGATGIRSRADGSKQKTVFASGITGWRAQWLPDGRIFLLEDPADGVAGYAYELKSGGSLIPLLRALPGLTILPHASSSALIFGESTGGGPALFAQVSASATPVRLPIRTIAEKCVWAPGKSLIAYCAVPQSTPSGNFLDDWYRGVAHTTDAWWQVDASAGTAQLIYTPDVNLSLDVENPAIDSSGNYIAFMNARDLSLWILRINK